MPHPVFSISAAKVKAAALHPRRPWVLLACHDGFVELWDYVVGALVERFRAHNAPVRCLDFHPTQPIFATAGDDCQIKIWDLLDRHLICTLSGHTDYVRTVSFHQGALPYLLSASDDCTACVWNWQSRQRLADLAGHADMIMCASWHPTELLVATASLDNTVRVWDVSNIQSRQPDGVIKKLAKNLLSLPQTIVTTQAVGSGHSRRVNWVCWVPDDKNYFLSGADDGTVKVWRLNRGTPAGAALLGSDAVVYSTTTLTGHTGAVNAVVQSRKNVLISAGVDGTLRFVEPKSKTFVGQLTARELGAERFSDNGQPSRFWCLAEHATRDLWVAGHDFGAVLFSSQLPRPVFALDRSPEKGRPDTSAAYYVSGHKLHTATISHGAEAGKLEAAQALVSIARYTARAGGFGAGKVVAEPASLLVLGSPFPFVVTYFDGRNRFFAVYASERDCSAKAAPAATDTLCSPARISKSRIAWVALEGQDCVLKTAIVGTAGMQEDKEYVVRHGLQEVFAGPVPNRVLLGYDNRLEEVDLEASEPSSSAPGAQAGSPASYPVVRNSLLLNGALVDAVYSPDREFLGLVGSNLVLILSARDFSVLGHAASHAGINSACWALLGRGFDCTDAKPRPAHCFMYSTQTHVHYLIPGSRDASAGANPPCKSFSGTVTSLNLPVSLIYASGQSLYFIDQDDDLHCIDFDSRVSGLFQAVADGREEDARTLISRMRTSEFGLAIASRLLVSGNPDVALSLVPDSASQLRQKVAMDMGYIYGLDLDASGAPCTEEALLRLHDEACAQGQFETALQAARRLRDPHKIAYIYSLFGIRAGAPGFAEVDRTIIRTCGSPEERLNAAILVGDHELLCKLLRKAGLGQAAAVFAEANGVSLRGVKPSAGLSRKRPTAQALARLRGDSGASSSSVVENWPVAEEVREKSRLALVQGGLEAPGEPQARSGAVESKRFNSWGDEAQGEQRSRGSQKVRSPSEAGSSSGSSKSASVSAAAAGSAASAAASSAPGGIAGRLGRLLGARSGQRPAGEGARATGWGDSDSSESDDSASSSRQRGERGSPKNPLLGPEEDLAAYLSSHGLEAAGALAALGELLPELTDWAGRMERTGRKEGAGASNAASDSPCPLALGALRQRHSAAADLVTNGEFEVALEYFCAVLRAAILASLPCVTELDPSLRDDAAELQELRSSAVQYIFGLRAELEKRSSPEADGARACELSILFALRPMLPEHRVLALRAAMNKCKKYGADAHARALATQLLSVCEKLRPEEAEESAKKAKKVLSKKTEGEGSPKSLSFSPEEYSSVQFCTQCFSRLQSKKTTKTCSACGAAGCADEAGRDCGICGLGRLE